MTYLGAALKRARRMVRDGEFYALSSETFSTALDVIEAANKLGCRASEEYSEPWLSFCAAMDAWISAVGEEKA